MKLEAVIFDFDGVIADTMHDNYKAWKKVFAEHNVEIDGQEFFLMEGMSRNEIAAFFIEKHKLEGLVIGTIVDKKEWYYKQDNSFRIYDEIPAIFELLKSKNIKTGLVTGAGRERLEATLNEEWRSFFDVIITSDEVKNGKPHPEPYLKAIEKLKSNPNNTLVIENAKQGIRSAKAAGCQCIAVETTLSKMHLTEADEIFSHHQEILNYFVKNYEY